MIYVTKHQLDQVEYLIHQSIQGNHILFDSETVRGVFQRKPNIKPKPVEHLIEELITQPTLAEKRAYLEGLEPDTLDHVIRTYFNIVENNIYERLEVTH